VQQHPAYASGRATAFVADAGRDALAAPGGPVPAGGVDYATMVFMLSALGPEAMPQVGARVPGLAGGRALVRPRRQFGRRSLRGAECAH
jgi:hypothetical protein